jgi:hypothetical protein
VTPHTPQRCDTYCWVPLNPRVTPPSLAAKTARFARFCDAYGEGIARQDVFDTLAEQLLVDADSCEAEAAAGAPGFAKLAGWNIPDVLRDDSAHLKQQREILCGQR